MIIRLDREIFAIHWVVQMALMSRCQNTYSMKLRYPRLHGASFDLLLCHELLACVALSLSVNESRTLYALASVTVAGHWLVLSSTIRFQLFKKILEYGVGKGVSWRSY